ncbi:hypothetical protein FQR65_LT15740 [Abscondita terminalis]|nr:hypothetical protein FQR65_LT15740 [Abscondita terminalis]
MQLYYKLLQLATKFCDDKLLAVLSAGDLVAQEAKYHLTCLSNFLNKCRTKEEKESMAFADLCSYVQDKLTVNEKEFVFKMSDLTRMYTNRLSQLPNCTSQNIAEAHTTRLREKILAHFPQLRATKAGTKRSFSTKYSNIGDEIRRTPHIPNDYGVVSAFVLPNREPSLSSMNHAVVNPMCLLGLPLDFWIVESDWLNHARRQFATEALSLEVSWAAFHANKHMSDAHIQHALNALLLPFYEKSDSVAVVRHGMNIIKGITQFLKGDQVPVLCVDQPFYAI